MIFRELGRRLGQQLRRLETGRAVRKVERHPLMAGLADHLADVVLIAIAKVGPPQLMRILVADAGAALADLIALKWHRARTVGHPRGGPLGIWGVAFRKFGRAERAACDPSQYLVAKLLKGVRRKCRKLIGQLRRKAGRLRCKPPRLMLVRAAAVLRGEADRVQPLVIALR